MRHGRTVIVCVAATLTIVALAGWGLVAGTVSDPRCVSGVIYPGWQLWIQKTLTRSRLEPYLEEPFTSCVARHMQGPFWTPNRQQILALNTAFQEFLRDRASQLDPTLARDAQEYGCHSVASYHRWNGEPLDAATWTACLSMLVLDRLSTYHGQYFGVTYEGRPVVYLHAWNCWELDWWSRLSPAHIIDGGDRVIHVFYDPIAQSIVLFSVNPYS